MLRAAPGADFEALTGGFATGLTGTVGVRLRDGQGGDAIAHTTAGISEDIAASGIYRVTLTAPETAGQYWLIWDNGSGGFSEPEQLLVTSSLTDLATPSGRDLCELGDALRYIPGYTPAPDTDATFQALITSISLDTFDQIGREFVARGTPGETRLFEIDGYDVEEREVLIGDATSIDTVEIHDQRGNTLQTVPDASYVLLPRSRDAWQPVTSLSFPVDVDEPAILALSRLSAGIYYDPGTWRSRRSPERLLAVTASWGFPQIPSNVREAVAKLVIVRYLTDVADTGTAITDAMDNINIAGLYRSATESLQAYRAIVVG